jgi:hypothetical protein
MDWRLGLPISLGRLVGGLDYRVIVDLVKKYSQLSIHKTQLADHLCGRP